MEFLSIFTILYQNGDIIKSWKHAPIMDFACIKTWKPMPNAKLRLPRSSIITPVKRIQLCYMMLIIGENTLVLRLLKVRRWTTTAIECYKRGCNCEGCFYTDFFNKSSQKCQMKASVLELVRVLGKPDVEIQQILQEE